MTRAIVISSRANACIQGFINNLVESDNLNRKTLMEYSSDLRSFAHWFKAH